MVLTLMKYGMPSISRLTIDLPHFEELEYHNAQGVHSLSTGKVRFGLEVKDRIVRKRRLGEKKRGENRDGGTYSALEPTQERREECEG